MSLIKHSKYKNTGILFELLVRQVTSDTLNGSASPALNIIKKYFVKSELGKELKLYESLTKSKKLNESRSNLLLQTILESAKKLNRKNLKREKYNLINEIKKHYNLDEFFKTKLPNYKSQAALYTLMEAQNSAELISPDQIVSNKYTLLEHLTLGPVNQERVKEEVLEEFQTYDKDVRMLTYKILLEKFNGKYSNLYNSQKEVLKEFITSVDSTPKLRNFYNNKIQDLRSELKEISKTIADKVVQIKLNEVLPLIVELEKNYPIKTDNLVDLLQYCELVEELKAANGKPIQ
jgi:hypothetical protein